MTGAPETPSCWDCNNFVVAGRLGCRLPVQTCRKAHPQLSWWSPADRLVIRPALDPCDWSPAAEVAP
jgi:hypothetical protein